MMLHLVVGDVDHEVKIDESPEGGWHVVVDGEPFDVVLERRDGALFARVGGKVYRVDRAGRTLFVGGERADVGVRHLGQAGLQTTHAASGEVRPPMPGKIVDVLVKPGDSVAAGQPLVILEAMKMRNEITAPGAGKVKEVRVKKGDAVEAKDVVVVLEAG